MLTNDEIILLDNLMYLGKGVPDIASEDIDDTTILGADSYKDQTIGEWLNEIDFSLIDDEKKYGACNYMTGRDWKNIISAALNSENLKNMKIATTHIDESEGGGKGFSALFVDPNGEEAVVAFRGTAGTDEWYDNFMGGNMAQTPAQRNALNWYKQVYYAYDLKQYGTITATGHSKGGNKSKYITIMDDTIDRCIALDGQGFSDKFFIENSYQVAKNQNKIQNLCVDYDYVNLLLSDVGSKTYYVKQEIGEGGFLEYHCPNTFLKFDEKGNYSIEINPNGQDPALKQVDEFFNGYLRSLSEENRNKTLTMMHEIVQELFHINVYPKEHIVQFLIGLLCKPEYSENAAEFLAYLVKYDHVHPEFALKLIAFIKSFSSGYFTELIVSLIKMGLDVSPLIPSYLEAYNPFINMFGAMDSKLIGFLKMFREKIKSVKINENGSDIWIGPLIPKMTRTSLTSEKAEAVHEQEDGYKGCYFVCDVSGMRAEADNLIRYSKKYEQIIAEVEGHANNLSFSSSATDAIRQSLLSVAARMRIEKEKLNELGKVLHTITNMYEATENSVVVNAQGRRSVSHNPAVGLPVKMQLT